MKEKIMSMTIVALMVIGSFGAVVLTINDIGLSKKTLEYISGEVIVGFTDDVDVKELQIGDRDPVLSNEITQILDRINVVVVSIPKGQEDRYVNLYESFLSVKYAEKNGIIYAASEPNDPGWYRQWGPENIGCLEAWDYSYGSKKVTIAIVDTGVDKDHDDLKSRLDTANAYGDWDDTDGHGTHCAGIAAAVINNNVGIAGVAGYNEQRSTPNVHIMPVETIKGGSGSASDVAGGIVHAYTHDADVISMSLGHTGTSYTIIEDACKDAWRAGCVLVAAAGNGGDDGIGDDNDDTPHYPSNYDCVISVAAINSQNKKASFSNYGDNSVDFAAPGVDIYSTYKSNSYKTLSGTSMACPHVAGVAALAIARYPNYSNQQIRDLMNRTADNVGGVGTYWKHGHIDATLDGNFELEMPKVDVVIDKVTNDNDQGTPGEDDGLDYIDIDDIGEDHPEWFYEVEVIEDGETSSVKNFNFQAVLNRVKEDLKNPSLDYFYYEGNNPWLDDDMGDMTWSLFQRSHLFGAAQPVVTVKIKLKEEDWFEFTRDIADISERPNADGDSIFEEQKENGRVFTAKYDLINHRIKDAESDRYETDGSLYYTRGDWDGSTDPEGILDLKQDDAQLWFKITDDYKSLYDLDISTSGKKIEKHTVNFEGKTAEDCFPETWSWKFGDGKTGTGKSTSHTYDTDGEYNVILTVTDVFDQEKSYPESITINPNQNPNKPSTPNGPTSGAPGNTYTYTTSATDPDGDTITTYEWSFGDGTTTTSEPSATHTWSEKGSYSVKVRAKDGYGGVSEWSDPLKVSMPKSKSNAVVKSTTMSKTMVNKLNNRMSALGQLLLPFLEQYPQMSPILGYLLGL